MFLLILVLWGLGVVGLSIVFRAVPGPVWSVIHKDGKPSGLVLCSVLALWPLLVACALIVKGYRWVMVLD